jgi:ABC-type transporter Mla subunit MlaD
VRFPHKAIVLLSALAGAAVATGIAFATIPGSDGVIHACYAANGSGVVNVIDPTSTDGSVPTSCVKGQASFDFNQTGPAGPPGGQGAQGPAGPAGHLSPTATAALEQDIAQIQQEIRSLNASIATIPRQQSQQRTAFLRLERRFASATNVAAQVNDLNELSNQTSLALQRGMDRTSKFLTALSNLMKKVNDTADTQVQNLK